MDQISAASMNLPKRKQQNKKESKVFSIIDAAP
jgi:hypothetical protein